MSSRLFVYGSLRDECVFENVTGEKKPSNIPAQLNGYEYREPIDGYPTIGSGDGGMIEGELLEPINDTTLAKIDAYEDNGVDYHRISVWVETKTAKAEAFVYVGAK